MKRDFDLKERPESNKSPVSNADFAARGYAWAVTRFVRAYGEDYWKSFGNSYAEVVRAASEADRKQLFQAIGELSFLVAGMLSEYKEGNEP